MKPKVEIEYCPNPVAIIINTSFNIQINPALKVLVENIDGVEDIDTWGVNKYDFLVCIGKVFNREEVANKIREKVLEFVSEEIAET